MSEGDSHAVTPQLTPEERRDTNLDESGAPVGNTSEYPYLGTDPIEESTVTPIQIKSVSSGASDAYKPEGPDAGDFPTGDDDDDDEDDEDDDHVKDPEDVFEGRDAGRVNADTYRPKGPPDKRTSGPSRPKK